MGQATVLLVSTKCGTMWSKHHRAHRGSNSHTLFDRHCPSVALKPARAETKDTSSSWLGTHYGVPCKAETEEAMQGRDGRGFGFVSRSTSARQQQAARCRAFSQPASQHSAPKQCSCGAAPRILPHLLACCYVMAAPHTRCCISLLAHGSCCHPADLWCPPWSIPAYSMHIEFDCI